MYTGNPGSPPPSNWAPNNDLGPSAGDQAKEQWLATETDGRVVCEQKRAPHLWRVVVTGVNVLVDLSWGTKAQYKLTGLETPIRVTLPGACSVYVQPKHHVDGAFVSQAQVSCTPVTSGCCESECRKLFSTVGPIEPLAQRFVALEASAVRVGPADASIVVNLTALQSVSLIEGSALTSGGGFLEFEP